MYNEKIEELINAALADGNLTEKEKQVLFKKAQSQGIDLDEFEMVLDARLFELKKAEEEKKLQKAAPKSNKLGDIRKCPNCGAVIGSFQMICPECGYEFSGVGSNKFVEKFSNELQKALEKPERRSSSLIEDLDITGLSEQRSQDKATIKKEANFVKNYPLPMTKEDCVEMLNFILPKTHLSGANGATREWCKKYEAILNKLEFENKENQKIQELVTSYRKQAKMSWGGKLILWYKTLSVITKVILWIVLFYAIFFGLVGGFVKYALESGDLF